MLATLRMPVNYKSSGVDIEAGDALVDWLAADAKKNASVLQNKLEFSKNLVDGIGGFASLFRMNFPKIKKPVLITCTDGVGTKVKLASRYQRFDQVGQEDGKPNDFSRQDLVAFFGLSQRQRHRSNTIGHETLWTGS